MGNDVVPFALGEDPVELDTMEAALQDAAELFVQDVPAKKRKQVGVILDRDETEKSHNINQLFHKLICIDHVNGKQLNEVRLLCPVWVCNGLNCSLMALATCQQ